MKSLSRPLFYAFAFSVALVAQDLVIPEVEAQGCRGRSCSTWCRGRSCRCRRISRLCSLCSRAGRSSVRVSLRSSSACSISVSSRPSSA